MSIFSECTIQVKGEPIIQMCVSNSSINPSIAICTPSRIMLYSDNGDKHDYELQRGVQPTAVEWHPTQQTLAIGWQNGTITLWSEDVKQAKEETAAHKEGINLIRYNSTGSRMVTADSTGLVIVWRGITQMCSYLKEGIMTHCIFAELNNIIKSSNLFFFGGKAGLVCLADDSKHCSEVCKVVGSIKSLMIYESQNSVIIITSGLLLVQFKISATEKSAPDKKVKLSIAGDVEQLNSVWIGHCLVATSSNENMIRMWQLDADENYVMTLHDMQDFTKDNILNDKLACCAYNQKTRHLVAGTKEGRVVFWKNMAQDESPMESEQWKALPFISTGKAVQAISIGKNNGVMAARNAEHVVKIIQETVVAGRLCDNVRILQVDSNKILIYLKGDNNQFQMFMFDSKYNIKSIDCTSQFLMIQSASKIEIHEFSNSQIISRSTIDKKCIKVAIYGEDLILVNENTIEIANFKGVSKQSIQFSESDGIIESIQITGKTLVVWTSGNYFRLFDMGRREYKQMGVNRKFENVDGPLGKIKLCSVNSDGTKVGILSTNPGVCDKFYVYDLDVDTFQSFDCPPHRTITDLQWDQNDARFFGVLTTSSKGKSNEEDDQPDQKNLKFYTFFYNAQVGIREQDQYTLEASQEAVLAVRIPQIFLIYRTIQKEQQTFRITDQLMNDFVGLEKADEPTKRAVMNFSYHLSSGNLDEAYKSVKSIQNPAVWEKMAQMSVKTRRLDVAEICIGNMRFARGSKAIRETKKESEFEAQLGMVAIQLGMISEAEKLYQQCKRYDLLNQLYQASGDWTKALEVAEKHDRINLLSTYFNLAKNYETSKEYDQAVEYYEKSGNGSKEVPRMLLESDEMQMLEDYINRKKDPTLYKWWANYMESQENFEQAVKFYRDANDTLGVVRILIHQNNLRHAKDFCNEKMDPAAFYYLAKYLESQNIIPEAIQFYARAQYYSQAVRLAKDQNMISDVMSLSLQAPKQVMIQSAIYFEGKSIIDKAVILFMKGGQLNKAMQLAQKNKLTEYVKKINQEMALQSQDEPEQQPSQQTQSKQQQEQQQAAQKPKSVPTAGVPGSLQDLLNRKQFEKALELCASQGIVLTDDIVKKMVDETDEKKRKDFQILIAEKAKKMGNFDVASKIYIALGERVKAMKALIKLGDVEKVIAFANNARMAEIYVLAGNFLQTGDWHKTPELMKHIIQFYNKAKAFDHLAVFFDACSTVEIDEYRDYEKACAALKEAIKHSQKSTNTQKSQQLQQKLVLIELFVKARSTSDPNEMLRICNDLLANPNIEYAIRQGDLHAELVEYYYSQKQFDKAYEEMQKMQKKSIVLNPYLDQEIIQTVMNYMKQKQPQQAAPQQKYNMKNHQDDEDNFEEEVIDDNI